MILHSNGAQHLPTFSHQLNEARPAESPVYPQSSNFLQGNTKPMEGFLKKAEKYWDCVKGIGSEKNDKN